MGQLSRSANKGSANNYGVKDVAPLDYTATNQAGLLTTKVYHGVSITSGDNASVIGRIQSWQPDSYTRDGIHLYELADISFGRPVEFIPGKATGFTIAVTRAEVWESEMEIAFGFDLFDDLIDQTRPFSVREFWIKGKSGISQVWDYKGCWFTSKNIDAITSDGDGVTKISATLAYVSRLKTVVTG
jgi:hypothetical protein